jgi:hypothetical protein
MIIQREKTGWSWRATVGERITATCFRGADELNIEATELHDSD